jgi:hypothetical protein
MKASSSVSTLDDAVAQRSSVRTNAHSDRGSQFRSRNSVHALLRKGLRGSMGRVGACGDNALWSPTSLCCRKTSSPRRWSTRAPDVPLTAEVAYRRVRDNQPDRTRGPNHSTPRGNRRRGSPECEESTVNFPSGTRWVFFWSGLALLWAVVSVTRTQDGEFSVWSSVATCLFAAAAILTGLRTFRRRQ